MQFFVAGRDFERLLHSLSLSFQWDGGAKVGEGLLLRRKKISNRAQIWGKREGGISPSFLFPLSLSKCTAPLYSHTQLFPTSVVLIYLTLEPSTSDSHCC